jgi:CxxC motif-containing protein
MTFPADEKITHYLCIGCPLGCRLEVEEDEVGEIVEVRGFACRKGKTFAEREHTDPRRMVTTTVTVTGGRWARLPVRTTADVQKGRVWEVVRALREVEVAAPVTMGDVIVTDILGSGADVVATRDMPLQTQIGPASRARATS